MYFQWHCSYCCSVIKWTNHVFLWCHVQQIFEMTWSCTLLSIIACSFDTVMISLMTKWVLGIDGIWQHDHVTGIGIHDNKRTVQMTTWYTYNLMDIGRRSRLTKGKRMHMHHNIHNSLIKAGRKSSTKWGTYTMWEQKEAILFLAELAHINLQTNNKVYKHTYFWSFDICSVAPTLLDVLWLSTLWQFKLLAIVCGPLALFLLAPAVMNKCTLAD